MKINYFEKGRACLALFVLLAIYTVQSYAQDDISQYLDDGNVNSSRNIIKLNVVPLFQHELSFYWEHNIYKGYGFEVGAGYLSSNYNYFNPTGNLYFSKLELSSPGFLLSASVNSHFQKSMKGFCFSLGAELRNFKEIRTTDLYTGMGWKIPIFRKIILEPVFKIGFTIISAKVDYLDEYDDPSRVEFAVPLNLKIGYLF